MCHDHTLAFRPNFPQWTITRPHISHLFFRFLGGLGDCGNVIFLAANHQHGRQQTEIFFIDADLVVKSIAWSELGKISQRVLNSTKQPAASIQSKTYSFGLLLI